MVVWSEDVNTFSALLKLIDDGKDSYRRKNIYTE